MPGLVNVDPLNEAADGAPDPNRLLLLGIRGVRLVVRDDARIRQYIAACQSAGLIVLGTITEGSGGYMAADQPCDLYQLGNEPDDGGHGDSKSPADYVKWWNIYYGTWFDPGAALAGRPVIGAGLSTGQVTYWRDVRNAGGLRGAAALDVHPYSKTAVQTKYLIQAYQAFVPDLPVWVTEWNRPTAEMPAYLAMLRTTPGVAGHAWFCWHTHEQWTLGWDRARLFGALG